VLEKTVQEQSAEVARQLRKNDLAGSTIKLKIRWPDFTTLTRQTTLQHRTDQEDEIAKAALDLLKVVRKPNQAVRLIGVGVTGLGQPIRQLGLWDTSEAGRRAAVRMDSEKEHKLQAVLDKLQEKYGKNIIKRGNMS
jgi:DNA polymerase-4